MGQRVMGALDWALLLLLSVLWGASFFFAAVALRELPPFTIVFARVGLAALALNLLLGLLRLRLPRDGATWRAFVTMGLINNLIPFSLIFWGQTQIASGLAAILNATTPLFTALLAHVLTGDERLTPLRLGGVLLGLGGVAVMIGPQLLHGLGAHAVAELAVLAAAVSYACAALFGRRFRTLPPLVTATGQVSATTLLMLPVVAFWDRPWTLSVLSSETIAAVLALGLVSTALAYVLYFRILARGGAVNAALVTLLIPPSALLLGIGILGEQLAAQHLAGMVLIAGGLLAIDGRAPRRLFGGSRYSGSARAR